MANEAILKFGAAKTLEANGAAVANNAIAQAAASYNVATDGGAYPDARFAASFSFAVAPVEGTVLALHARPLNLIAGGNAEAPEATRPTRFVGAFVVNNVTTVQYAELIARDVPWEASYFLHNNGTGQAVSAGWKLVATPFTIAPAA